MEGKKMKDNNKNSNSWIEIKGHASKRSEADERERLRYFMGFYNKKNKIKGTCNSYSF